MPKGLAAHLLVHIISGLLKALPQKWIEVSAIVLQPQEPAHVVDAGLYEIDLILGNPDIARDEVHGRLHAVAQADKLDVGGANGPAHHGHGVHIVEQQGARAQLLHVPRHVDRHRNAAKRPKDAARPHRIADALVDAVLERDVDIIVKALHAADLKGGNYKISVAQRLSPIRGDIAAGRQAIRLDDALDEPIDLRRSGRARRHEGEFSVLQSLRLQDVQD